VAKGRFQIQIETRQNHELSISDQAITDFGHINVRTAVCARVCLIVLIALELAAVKPNAVTVPAAPELNIFWQDRIGAHS
jgi:hypothetical protein